LLFFISLKRPSLCSLRLRSLSAFSTSFPLTFTCKLPPSSSRPPASCTSTKAAGSSSSGSETAFVPFGRLRFCLGYRERFFHKYCAVDRLDRFFCILFRNHLDKAETLGPSCME